ncbi:MAG: glycosyl transferase family 2 [Gemmatimonadota bacterium]|nr:glycosyl transferase family 2 [Gemmatimonadota bacterium]
MRNESRVIGRCLESVLPYVDGAVICDTGSTDDTVDRIGEITRAAGAPLHLAHHPWVNFGQNRTRAATEARQWIRTQGWSPENCWLLLLDADMVLVVDPSFDREALTATSYEVEQDDGIVRYSNTRLIRLSVPWESVGPTHEYWRPVVEAGESITSAPLPSLLIRDMTDGGSKESKFERDIDLLTRALTEEPDNVRYVFYLAQSHYDIRQWAKAAELYELRWRMGGWSEERWFARYRQGLALLNLGEGERGAGVLLEAFNERPTRAEPLMALARHYRQQGRCHAALPLVLWALQIPWPKNDVLFIERHVYEWRLLEELVLTAIHVGEQYHGLAVDACDRLLARTGEAEEYYAFFTGARRWYQPEPVSGSPSGLAVDSGSAAVTSTPRRNAIVTEMDTDHTYAMGTVR